MNIIKKSTLWGAAIMFVVSALGAMLGPSPLNLLFAPIMMLTTAPLWWLIKIIPALDAIAAGGMFGTEGSFINYPFYALLVGWNVCIGSALGALVGRIKQRRRDKQ